MKEGSESRYFYSSGELMESTTIIYILLGIIIFLLGSITMHISRVEDEARKIKNFIIKYLRLKSVYTDKEINWETLEDEFK